MEKVIIIGSGPAGLTAALYSARANLEPLVIEGASPYGQLMLTSEVENYPGFPEGIQGPELMQRFRAQAERFGARFLTMDATGITVDERPFTVQTEAEAYQGHTLIISTGAKARTLEVPGEKELFGRGISTCATCDGFFFREKELVVVGGGDSAMEEAIFLTKFATKVTIVHRRDTLRASKIMAERALKHPKIEFIWNATITEYLGDPATGAVHAVELADTSTGAKREFRTDGVFIAIGHDPNTALFRGKLDLLENDYLSVRHPSTQTSVPGIFGCGDVVDFTYRQAVTAAGSGCQAAIDAERYLESLEG